MMELIPKIIHFVYHPDKLSDVERGYIEKARSLHPDWEIREWAEPYDPSQFSLSRLWKYCKRGAQLADLVRVDVIAQHGGIYADADFEVLQNLDCLLPFDFVVGTEDGAVLTNAFFGSKPRGTAVETLRAALANLDPEDFEGRIDLVTGPGFFARHLRYRDDVTVLPREVLYPYNYDEKPPEHFRSTTLAVHRWHGSWIPKQPFKNFLRQLRDAALEAARDVRRAVNFVSPATDKTLVYNTDAPLVVRSRHGQFLHVGADDLSLTPRLVAEGCQKLADELFIGRWLRGGDWFVDVGANVGVTAVLAGHHVGPMGRVLAFEPHPAARSHLQQSVALNRFEDRVKIYPWTAGHASSQARMAFSRRRLNGAWRNPGSSPASSRVATAWLEPDETVDVEVVRLDDLLPKPFCVRLLKIEAEGQEALALEGARELIASARADAILLRHSPQISGSEQSELLKAMRSLISAQFSLHLIDDDGEPQPAKPTTATLRTGRSLLLINKTAPPIRLPAK